MEEWIEYECPVTGLDFDVSPIPAYGSKVWCSDCQRYHVMATDIAQAYRKDDGGLIAVIDDEWRGEQ